MKEKTAPKRDLARTRRRILDAAAREFAAKGAAGARVDEIARRARVNKAMIYYIFGSKRKLQLAVLEDLFEEKTRNVEKELGRPEMGLNDLIAMLAEYFDALRERREYARILLDDLATGAHQLRLLKRRRPDLFRVFGATAAAVRRLIEAGLLPELDADRAVLTVIIVLVTLAAAGPHLDLAADAGPAGAKSLSDPEGWKKFFAGIIQEFFRGARPLSGPLNLPPSAP